MSNNKLIITVYGREQICASCIGAPGSWDTYEWLQAAIGRKYSDEDFIYEYVDMDKAQQNDKHKEMIAQIEEEDLFYPLVLLNGKIIAEGIPRLKTIFKEIDQYSES